MQYTATLAYVLSADIYRSSERLIAIFNASGDVMRHRRARVASIITTMQLQSTDRSVVENTLAADTIDDLCTQTNRFFTIAGTPAYVHANHPDAVARLTDLLAERDLQTRHDPRTNYHRIIPK